ncbi:hypothetical protein ABZV29_41775 [Streptomyces sp. NPDC005236]|uniref:hypothetical protein n=1 Tax=Streptomyces sp. NPDC005236 TaxID=3157028 RepID=UPI0033B759CB
MPIPSGASTATRGDRFGRLPDDQVEVGLRTDQRDDRLVHRHRVGGPGAARALGHAAHLLRLTVQVDRGGGQPGRGEDAHLFTTPGAAAVDGQAVTLITRKARASRSAGEISQSSEYHPPRHWLPDPVAPTGATFYAFAGAALREAVDTGTHYFTTEGIPALCDAAETALHYVTTLLG